MVKSVDNSSWMFSRTDRSSCVTGTGESGQHCHFDNFYFVKVVSVNSWEVSRNIVTEIEMEYFNWDRDTGE